MTQKTRNANSDLVKISNVCSWPVAEVRPGRILPTAHASQGIQILSCPRRPRFSTAAYKHPSSAAQFLKCSGFLHSACRSLPRRG